ncbi:MAG: hypothetical protein Q4E77_06690 [Conchiformibius sp.]|nr:hypothetical protein [Conchiformibius sp.]
MNFIIWVLFPSIVVGLIICQFKEKIWQVFALLGCIALTIFIGTTAQLYWQKSSPNFINIWNAATGVFTFFGVLLTAGAAFATVAAVISYFSVNDKLKRTEKDLEKAEAKISAVVEKSNNFESEIEKRTKQLDEWEELEKRRNEADKLAGDIEVLAQHDATNIDEAARKEIKKAANEILSNPQAGFEARLKARAIIQDDKIYRKFEQVEANPSDEAWQQIIAMRQDNLAVWKLLFHAAPKADDAYDKAQNNYATALFNYGVALSFYGDYLREQDEIDKAVLQWQQAGQQYALVLEIKSDTHQAAHNWGSVLDNEAKAVAARGDLKAARALWKTAGEKYEQALDIKADKYEAAYNWGNALNAEARAVAASGDLETARALWKTAGEKYQLALDIKADKHEAAYNWFVALVNEAAYLSDTEQIQLWQNAKSQVLKLQNHSPEHQQSKVIQDLLNGIANAIVIQFPQQERKT